MAKRDRGTLKRFFQKGALPSSDHFSDLIDSTLNMREDGFSKTAENGMQLSTLANKNSLMSLYQRNDFFNPIWSIKFNETAIQNLDIVYKPEVKSQDKDKKKTADKNTPLLSLNPDGCVGINNPLPEKALDINGIAKSTGRMGEEEKVVYADSKFYDITEGLEGCHAIEVVAGVGLKFTGMYALVHAVALSTFNASNHWVKNLFSFNKNIKKQHTYYSSFSHRIKIRWYKKKDGKFYLQLGTYCNYSKIYQKHKGNDELKVRVRYHITELWHDHFMDDCLETFTAKKAEQGE